MKKNNTVSSIHAVSINLEEDAKKILFHLTHIMEGKDARQASGAMLSMLNLARLSTAFMQKYCIDKDGINKYPHNRKVLDALIGSYDSFPVNYNEMIDLSPYKKLKIGYALTKSKSPKKRSGASPFSQYAEIIFLALREVVVEQSANREGGKLLAAVNASKEIRSNIYANKKYRQILLRGLSEEAISFKDKINATLMSCDPETLAPLADLYRAEDWAHVGKELLKKAYPKCEEIKSLAAAIGDGEVKYESQIRARIIERIGRAVLALARE